MKCHNTQEILAWLHHVKYEIDFVTDYNELFFKIVWTQVMFVMADPVPVAGANDGEVTDEGPTTSDADTSQ